MKRETFRVALTRDGMQIGEATRYAFNSAVRAGEGLVRELARSEGRTYTGGVPQSTGERYNRETYTRVWAPEGAGATVTATVEKVQYQA